MFAKPARTFAALSTIVVVALSAPGSAHSAQPWTKTGSDRCHWAVSELPRSADAVEGWFRGCGPSDLPHSPSGVDGWTR